MAEISAPVPIQITARVEAQAAAEHIRAFDVDPGELTTVLQATHRTDITADTAAFTIGASKSFGGDSPKEPLFEGGYISVGLDKPEPAQPGSIGKDRHVIHLQIDHTQPITEADLAQRTAETLLVPAHHRNNLYNRGLMGLLGLGSGSLFSTVALANHLSQPENTVSPGTWAWLGAAGVTLATGIVGFARGAAQNRRLNNAERRAALHTPIKVQR